MTGVKGKKRSVGASPFKKKKTIKDPLAVGPFKKKKKTTKDPLAVTPFKWKTIKDPLAVGPFKRQETTKDPLAPFESKKAKRIEFKLVQVKQEPEEPQPSSSRQLRQRAVQDLFLASITSPQESEKKDKKPKLKLKNKKKLSEAAAAAAAEDKENMSIQDFCKNIQKKCVISDKWCVFEPREDPSRNQLCIVIQELDLSVEGDVRIKRAVKIYEDRSYSVLIDNVDMTHVFAENKKLSAVTSQEVYKLLYHVQRKKVCMGLRIFEPLESLFPKLDPPVHKRNNIYYANGCSIVVQKTTMGNSCTSCQRIRNQLKRKEANEGRRTRKPAHKMVKSSFGKALFSALNDFSGKGPIPPSQYSRHDMVYDEKLDIHMSRALQERLELVASMPPPPPPPPKKSKRGRNNSARGGRRGRNQQQQQQQMGYAQAIPVQEFITEDGQICYITNGLDAGGGQLVTQMGEPIQWGQMVVEKFEPPDMEEQLVTIGEGGNIIIQNINGEEFQLAPGQEYELIGESSTQHPQSDPIEIMPADPEQIEIIGLDDETMEQMQLHGSMENMQIAAVDPNDPNFSQLIRAFQQQM